MGTYNVLKNLDATRGIEEGALPNFGNDAFADLVTTLTTQPFDIVKTLFHSARGVGTWEAFKSIVIDDGVKGFGGGAAMRLGRRILRARILLMTRECMVNLINPLF